MDAVFQSNPVHFRVNHLQHQEASGHQNVIMKVQEIQNTLKLVVHVAQSAVNFDEMKIYKIKTN